MTAASPDYVSNMVTFPCPPSLPHQPSPSFHLHLCHRHSRLRHHTHRQRLLGTNAFCPLFAVILLSHLKSTRRALLCGRRPGTQHDCPSRALCSTDQANLSVQISDLSRLGQPPHAKRTLPDLFSSTGISLICRLIVQLGFS